ncbi:hypothetical protein Vafri_19591 [Volvox africanus]|uniref:Fido domain-containing protein n=1 Tax=Volvox africanus TaxID=51714 RepID=A0A8J4BQ05_9CHLO|nr:hypothetical protein Vafri_19591 [Volvox africanus]
MQGLHHNAGRIRDGIVVGVRADGLFYYQHPEVVPFELQCLIDQYNHVMRYHLTGDADQDCGKVFNLVAQFLLRFSTIHPCSDGNGTAGCVGRLLVNRAFHFQSNCSHHIYVDCAQYLEVVTLSRPEITFT